MLPPVSKRALQTEVAVIDDLLEAHGKTHNLFNLAPGSPAISPSFAVRQAGAVAALESSVSTYGDVLGYEPLRKRWLRHIFSQWDGDGDDVRCEANSARTSCEGEHGLELMVTAGANQVCVFYNLIEMGQICACVVVPSFCLLRNIII